MTVVGEDDVARGARQLVVAVATDPIMAIAAAEVLLNLANLGLTTVTGQGLGPILDVGNNVLTALAVTLAALRMVYRIALELTRIKLAVRQLLGR